MNSKEILKELKKKTNPKNIKEMARFGINPRNTLGVSIPEVRKIAKEVGKNHKLAKELWESGIHEARILAGFVGESKLMTEKEMGEWVLGFDSWDVCDQVCGNLFDKTEFAYKKVFEWSKRKEEFAKRAGFVLMACLSVHDKKAKNKQFLIFLSVIKREATDERNFVRKAVNWALRQIGKRNMFLNKEAIRVAKEIQKINSKAAKWIANNALRELQSEMIQKRLKSKN